MEWSVVGKNWEFDIYKEAFYRRICIVLLFAHFTESSMGTAGNVLHHILSVAGYWRQENLEGANN